MTTTIAFIMLGFLATTSSGRNNEEFFLRRYDSPGIEANLAENPPTEISPLVQGRQTKIVHYSDVQINSQQSCQCNWKGEWGDWSTCSTRTGKCYKATQMRIRRCQRDCVRIQVRTCLDKPSCTGTWSEWMNQTCVDGMKKSIRFCKSSTGMIGPYCFPSNGQAYQEKQESCEKNEKSIPTPELHRSSSKPIKHWTLSNKTNFIVIILAVIAGVLLVALIFVSVMLAKGKRRKSGRGRSITRDLRSASESNVSATSFLSGTERESRASGRVSMYQQNNKGTQRRRSLLLPRNYSIVSMTTATHGNIIVKAPLQHNDSLMLARKQISQKSNKGSVKSINKLFKEQQKCHRHDHVTLSADESDGSRTFAIGSDEDVVMATIGKGRQNIPQRRATDGSYDTYDRKKNRRHMSGSVKRSAEFTNELEKTKQEEANEKTSLVTKVHGPTKNQEEPDNDTSSMDNGFHKLTKKRLSVEDICKIFETRSAEQSPVRTPSKPMADDHQNQSAGEDPNRSKQEVPKKNSEDKPKNIIKSFKKKISASSLSTQSPKQNGTEPHFGEKASTLSHDLCSDINKENIANDEIIVVKERSKSVSSEKESTVTSKKIAMPVNGIKQEKRTFLFSSKAYDSLQRSNDQRYETVHQTPNGFKMNIDALMRKTDKRTSQELKRSSKEIKQHTYANGNFRRNSYHDPTNNGIIVPPPRMGQSSYDSDTYADVWDAKVKENNGKSTDSIYADVWDSDNTVTRNSYCANDDGDYSEVYNSLGNPKDKTNAKPRRFGIKSQPKTSRHVTKQFTPPQSEAASPRLWPTGQRLRTQTYSPPKVEAKYNSTQQGSVSCGSSPVRPPLPIHRQQRHLSRESSTGSDGSAPQDRFHKQIHQSHSHSVLSDLDDPSDPIYCAI